MTGLHGYERKREVKVGDIIYIEEDVFIKIAGRIRIAGRRVSIIEVVRAGIPGFAVCRVIKSVGVNADAKNAIIERPVANLLFGYCLNHLKGSEFDNEVLKKGGHLEGVNNGKKVQLTDAKKGGMSVGAKHTEDGIKGVVGTEERPIEFEGEEIILTAPVSNNPEKYEFEGKQMTGKEIASKINEDNGGVSFAKGGQPTCRCSNKQYNFGGTVMNDRYIIEHLNSINPQVQPA